jgi:hypothetical protein
LASGMSSWRQIRFAILELWLSGGLGVMLTAARDRGAPRSRMSYASEIGRLWDGWLGAGQRPGAERQDGGGLSVASLGGGAASGLAGGVAVSPLARVRIARTVACAICAAVAMSRWASPSRVARAIAWWRSCSASRRRRAARSTRVSSSRESAVRACCCPRCSAWATAAMGCPEAMAAVAASARAWASGPAWSGFSPASVRSC